MVCVFQLVIFVAAFAFARTWSFYALNDDALAISTEISGTAIFVYAGCSFAMAMETHRHISRRIAGGMGGSIGSWDFVS